MRTPSTIGIDDDLSARESSVTLRTANDEFARRVDMQMSVISVQRNRGFPIFQNDFFQSFLDNLLHNQFVHFLHGWRRGVWSGVSSNFLATRRLARLSMLSGNNHGVNFLGLN